jgi:hypothetical protein
MKLGSFVLDQPGLCAWLEADQRFAQADGQRWDPLEPGEESEVIDLLETAQARKLLAGPATLGLLYLDDPDGDHYYVTADITSEADGGPRLASASCDWEMIVPERQLGAEAAVAILTGITAVGEDLLRRLERFAAPGEQAAYDQAMQDSLDVTEGIEAHEICGCGEPIALYEGEWMHVYNDQLRGTGDHDAAP